MIFAVKISISLSSSTRRSSLSLPPFNSKGVQGYRDIKGIHADFPHIL